MAGAVPSRVVIDQARQAWSEADAVRRLVGLFAPAVAIIAALADPGSTGETVVAIIPVAALLLWAVQPSVPLVAVSVAVLVGVVVAQRSGGLEPSCSRLRCWPSSSRAARRRPRARVHWDWSRWRVRLP
jgi:hypothetical protein